MNLELRSIAGRGNISKERVTLRALANLDIGDFLLAQSGHDGDSPTLNLFHTYWFPFKRVQKGDLIVVYTKEGTDSTKPLMTGRTAHFYYFDLKQTIWDKPSRGALLLHTPAWESKASEEL